jgi:hypothetical protein
MWLSLSIIEGFISLLWKISISSVEDVFDWSSVNVWFIEFIELVVGQLKVVLDTITIFIVDLSLLERSIVPGECKLSKILWSMDYILVV